MDFPTTIDEITPEWLSATLGSRVRGWETTFLEGGVLSEAFKLHDIRYADAVPTAPASVVVKVPHHVAEQKQFALDGLAYTKELNFFQQLAAEAPIRSPKVYASHSDGSETCERFVIVMEDLTAHSAVFDQASDPPDEGFARRIALEVAALHAKFWETPATRLPWIGRADGRYEFAFDSVCRAAVDRWPEFRRLYQQMYGVDVFDAPEDAPSEELTALLCGPRNGAILDTIYALYSSRPKTVLHGDLRADNIFRTHGGGAEDAEITFIDWQLIHAGPPGVEFTEAWMHSLEPHVRRQDTAMLAEYHRHLLELNPSAAAYTYDQLLEDYALGYCLWWTVIITAGVDVLATFEQAQAARMKELWNQGARRSKVAMRELDCLGRVEALLARH